MTNFVIDQPKLYFGVKSAIIPIMLMSMPALISVLIILHQWAAVNQPTVAISNP